MIVIGVGVLVVLTATVMSGEKDHDTQNQGAKGRFVAGTVALSRDDPVKVPSTPSRGGGRSKPGKVLSSADLTILALSMELQSRFDRWDRLRGWVHKPKKRD